MKKNPELALPFVYDGETLVTSARQINFWGQKGAIGAVLAREVPFGEMTVLAPQLTIPAEVLVYGATCIHQSKRPLLQNYYNYTQQEDEKSFETGYQTWKLDGLFTPGTAFVSIVACFAQAKQLLTEGTWTAEQAASLSEQVRQLHPAQRGLDTGFYAINPEDIK